MTHNPDARVVAAVDLGSNSFHMVVAREVDGELQMIDRIKETVRLAGGLQPNGDLDQPTRSRALGCLRRFGERLAEALPAHVRVVGTNTLRRATAAQTFRDEAEAALGHPIEIISGREEARLIFLGVAHIAANHAGTRLVVDIGGGSSECVIGRDFDTVVADSLYMGCVSWSHRFFPEGEITAATMTEACTAARQKAAPIAASYRGIGWTQCVGSSGTVHAISAALKAHGWSEGEIHLRGLTALRDMLVNHGDASSVRGVKAERVPVLAGGVAILLGLFEQLHIPTMTPVQGALREGVLYDLLGRIRHEDIRERTIGRLRERFVLDTAQAQRVQKTAIACLRQVAIPWGLEDPYAETLLRWAAELHEAGLAVSYSGHHRHGAYLVSNSDLPGFSRDEQAVLASMILGHRRKLEPAHFAGIRDASQRQRVLRLTVLLRMATRLNRSRSDPPPPVPKIKVGQRKIELTFPPLWLQSHPLTLADLTTEAKRLSRAEFLLLFQ